ncbi:MAG: hypothetical protein IJK28_12320 [Clostridia bacterium]|nr:hypothetical protein [Clostridia bacterium]
MNEKEIVRAAIKSRALTQEAVAKACGYQRQSNLTRLLASDSMKVDSFLMVMDALGFDVIVTDHSDATYSWKLERIHTESADTIG